jgi:hypothetical protein
MTSKRRRLPKEGLGQPDEGMGPGEQFLDITDDVQGHGLPVTAPPAGFTKGTPTHGGELEPGDTSTE